MTCVIIQWVFNLHPILVIGKWHHLAFIKVEGDAFSLFAWTESGRETRGAANAQAHSTASGLAGQRDFESFISSIWAPPQAGISRTTGCGQAEGRASPQGERCPASGGDAVGTAVGTRWLMPLLPPQLTWGWIKCFL